MRKATLIFGMIGFFFQELSAQKLLKPKTLDFHFDSHTQISEEWKFITEEAGKVRLFLSGENHREVTFNSLAEYGFMNRLHKYAGYRHYVIELSPSRAYYLNRYIRNSDTHARDALKGITSPRYMNLFENLYRWNQQLDSQDRIWVHGLDVERFYDLSLEALSDVFKRNLHKSIQNDSLLAVIMAVVNFADQDFKERLAQYHRSEKRFEKSQDQEELEPESDARNLTKGLDFEEVISQLKIHRGDLLKFLEPEDLSLLNIGFRGIEDYTRWERDQDAASRFHWREQVMFTRLRDLLIQYPEGKFFGQFGRCHISETKSDQDCGWFSFSSLVNQISNRYFRSTDSVITVGYFYPDRSKDVSAQEYQNQERLDEELQLLLKPFQEGIKLYDLSDTTQGFTELRKKFRFVLVNNIRDKELNAEETKNESAELSMTKPSNNWNVYAFNQGLNLWELDFESLNEHFQRPGAAINAPVWSLGLQHDLIFKKGAMILGVSGFYRIPEEEKPANAYYSDSVGSLYFGNWGLDVLLGIHVSKSRFSADLLSRIGMVKSTLTYKEKLENLVNVSEVNGLNIYNQSWNVGIMGRFQYRLFDHLGLGFQASSYQNLGHGNWVYQGTNRVYQNLGMNSGMWGWGLSLQMCVFFSQ